MLVRLDPLPKVELFAPVELQISTPFGEAVIPAQVIQMLPGMGIAVGFSADSASELTALLAAARGVADPGTPADASFAVAGQDGTGAAAAARPERKPSPVVAKRARAAPPVDARTKIRGASAPEKVQIALHGTKEERMLLLRDGNRLIHQYVLKNPRIQIDEVATIAGMRTVAPELLKQIASRREWAQRPEVALALVRNPKTPVPLAVKLIDFVPLQHLRQLAKAGSVKPPIQKAARKKVLR
jgi:hypothetical protein